MPGVVAIIGRPNVGKSTLFNRIIGERKAIESETAGTTRDTLSSLWEGNKTDALFVDTGGIEFTDTVGSIEEDTYKQAKIAATEADLILFCINTKEELTNDDYKVAEFLRTSSSSVPIFVVGTQADGGGSEEDFPELYSLGIGEKQVLISAKHNKGIKKLLQSVDENLSRRGFGKKFIRAEDDTTPPRIAFFGRPNAGKSSLINALLGKNECIVSEIAGTTRDTKDLEVKFEKRSYLMIDTAGIRKRSKIDDPVEKYSVMRTFQALTQADVVVYLIDSKDGVTAQDQKLLGELQRLKTGVVLLANKWDLQDGGEEPQSRFSAYMANKIQFFPWAPVIFTSSVSKKNITKIFTAVDGIFEQRKQKYSTGVLNSFLEEVQSLHKPAGLKNKHPRMKYMVQTGINPPSFKIFGSKLDYLNFSYKRYFENRMRDAFGFEGTGISIEYAGGEKNPYDSERVPRKVRAGKSRSHE